ncbi:hypothetical protein HOA59_01720 [archaeon]|jgi:hypothetical protein|nr:hypothetical protein [archaeon]MBT6824134.1 hypothetical protein [archaeon]MBT7107022.1 hypothetical protein [archaeon]MBT7297634.1 hypothetical protein [archaeon]
MEEERIYLWPGYLIITTIVFLTLFFVLAKVTDGTSFDQSYLAKDISLVEQTLFVSPGEVSFKYNIKQGEDRFNIDIGDGCLIEVNLKDTSILSGSKSRCADNKYIFVDYSGKNDYDYLIFNKTSTSLSVTGGYDEE